VSTLPDPTEARREQKADDDYAEGRFETFDTVEGLLADLDSPVIHGVECYEAWRDEQDCPHENTQSKEAAMAQPDPDHSVATLIGFDPDMVGAELDPEMAQLVEDVKSGRKDFVEVVFDLLG
jgi:hypothetical protein